MNKNDTKMIQGLSVLAMVCLHLFCRENGSELYATPMILFGLPVSFYFAQISDFCVMGFALCSGYAHMTLCKKEHFYRSRLVSLLVLYGKAWLIMLLFTAAAALTRQLELTPKIFPYYLLNYTGILNWYNGAWWYLPVFAVLVIGSPLLMKFCKKHHWLILSVFIAVFYATGYYFRFYKTQNFAVYFNTSSFGAFFMTLAEYLCGAVLFKIRFFEKAKELAQKIKPVLFWSVSAAVTVGMMFVRAKYLRTLFVAPATGLVLITILAAGKKPKFVCDFFLFFGRHSTNIWLTHMFFYHTLFVNFVFIAKYPLLIYGFMLAICVALSYALDFLYKPFRKKILTLNLPKAERKAGML